VEEISIKSLIIK